MSCKYCEELEECMKRNTKEQNPNRCVEEYEPDVSLSELYFKYLGFNSGWSIPVHFCPNCGKELNK